MRENQRFCSLAPPINSWLDSPIAGTPHLLVVQFEDLRKNPIEGFTRIANFLELKVSAERIQQAVANNALDRMKEKERAEPQRASIKDQFVRSGSMQGWRAKLTPAQLELFDIKHAGSALERLGYPRSNAVTAGVDGRVLEGSGTLS